MSGRSTADLAATLHSVADIADIRTMERYPNGNPQHNILREAADRLAELEAKVTCTGAGDCKALAHIHGCYADHPCRHDDDLPSCPTCGGKATTFSRMLDLGLGDGPELVTKPCPDCIDGKVPLETVIAYWIARHQPPKRYKIPPSPPDLDDERIVR